MDSGVLNQVSLKLESTYGTAVVPDVSIPVNSSDGIQINQEVNAVEAIKGTAPKNKLFFKGKQSFEGSFEMGAFPLALGYFLKSAMGGMADSTIQASTVYKHTFTEGVTKPGITIEQKIGQIVKRFAGCVVNNWKLAAATGELALFTASVMGKSQADATAISTSYETSRPFNFADVSELSIAGTDIKAKVNSFEVEYDNGLEMFYGMGDNKPQNRYPKQSTLKGKLELYVDSATDDYLADLIAGTERELIITLTGDTIGSASNNILKLTMSKCAFTKYETKLDFDYNALTIEFEAREDSTNGLIKVELTNLLATY